MVDHVHVPISIPPKYAGSEVRAASREQLRSIEPVFTASGNAALWGSIPGQELTSCRWWVGTRRRSANISGTKCMRTSVWMK